MKKNKTESTIDCVAMKRRAQAKIYQEIKDLSPRQQVAYFRRRARVGTLGSWWRRLPKTVSPKKAA